MRLVRQWGILPKMLTNSSSSPKNDELTNYSSLFDEIFVKISANFLKIFTNFENLAHEKIVKFVDLVKSFPTSIWSQKSASIQPRTDLPKFGIEI